MLINTNLFKEEAIKFEKTGRYCDEPPGSSEYFKYWKEQQRRCIYGYSVGGMKITGNHYFYLNFCRIKLTREENINEKVTKKRIGKKITTFPDFWDGDYEFFWIVEIAKNGISPEDLKSLKLENKPLSLDGGKHVMAVKSRRKGFSFKSSSIAANKYTHEPKSLVIIGAYEYGYARTTISMAIDCLNFIDENTAWTKRRLVSTRDHVKSGYKENINNVDIVKGYQSEILALSFKDKPDVARGKDASLVIFEEAGTFAGLKAAYAATLPSLQDGSVTTGQLVCFGCVCAGTKVYDNIGRVVNIEDLNKEDGIIGYSNNSIFKDTINWMKPPAKKPCYKITTTAGTTISCSEDHPILWSKAGYNYNKRETINGIRESVKITKKTLFKETKDIKVKDQIAIINSVPIFNNEKMWQPRLVGLLIGDGSYGKNKTPILSNCDEDINNYIDNNFDTVIEKSYLTKKNKLYRETRIRGICGNLRELGIYGQTKNNKTLPINIHKYDKESLSKLLSGIFDTDGYIGKDRIVLTSSSENLLNEVKNILIKFGIHGKIYKIDIKKYRSINKEIKDKNDYFRLVITDNSSIINFYKNIPILIKYKKESLFDLVSNIKKGYEDIDVVFVEKNKNNKNLVNTINANGIRFETVKEIEFIGEQLVYNLTAGITHTYIANNVITHNTGGAFQAGILEFESMFYDPITYDFIEFTNVWDNHADKPCAYFFPDFQNKVGFMDKWGNSDRINAKLYEESLREQIKKTSRDPQALDRYIVERPFSPKEAFLKVANNMFPVAEIADWRNKLLSNSKYSNIGVAGFVKQTSEGLKFRPDSNARPIVDFPPKKDTDLTGCIVQYQPPYKTQSGDIPDNLYVICVDPYAFDETTGVSIGVAYVLKRINNFSYPDDMIVASYIGRPYSQDEFNDNLFLLAEYYNAKIGFENDRGNLIDYAKRTKKLKWLIEEIEIIDKSNNIHLKKLGRKYGISVGTKERKGQGNIYLRDWIKTKRGASEEEYSWNLHYIYDIALLDELIKYDDDGNFDRVSALRVGMYFLKDSYRKALEEQNEVEETSFWNRDLF